MPYVTVCVLCRTHLNTYLLHKKILGIVFARMFRARTLHAQSLVVTFFLGVVTQSIEIALCSSWGSRRSRTLGDDA